VCPNATSEIRQRLIVGRIASTALGVNALQISERRRACIGASASIIASASIPRVASRSGARKRSRTSLSRTDENRVPSRRTAATSSYRVSNHACNGSAQSTGALERGR
jgi:hypothetical protein